MNHIPISGKYFCVKYIVHTINNIVRDIHLKMCSTRTRALFPVLDEKGGSLGGVVEMMVSCSTSP